MTTRSGRLTRAPARINAQREEDEAVSMHLTDEEQATVITLDPELLDRFSKAVNKYHENKDVDIYQMMQDYREIRLILRKLAPLLARVLQATHRLSQQISQPALLKKREMKAMTKSERYLYNAFLRVFKEKGWYLEGLEKLIKWVRRRYRDKKLR